MGLGIADGGNYALYGSLGATGPQGLLVTMLHRARSLSVAILRARRVGGDADDQPALAGEDPQRKLRALREQHPNEAQPSPTPS